VCHHLEAISATHTTTHTATHTARHTATLTATHAVTHTATHTTTHPATHTATHTATHSHIIRISTRLACNSKKLALLSKLRKARQFFSRPPPPLSPSVMRRCLGRLWDWFNFWRR